MQAQEEAGAALRQFGLEPQGEAQEKVEAVLRDLKRAQKREQEIGLVLKLIAALDRCELKHRLLTLEKLRYYLYEKRVVTLEELAEMSGCAHCCEYTPQCLEILVREEYDQMAGNCWEDIITLSADAHHEKTVRKLREYNRKGNGLISEEEIGELGIYIHQLRVRAARQMLGEIERQNGSWYCKKSGLIEELVVFMKEHALDYAELETTKEAVLEKCTEIY
jgi:hypothetical protein